MNHNGTAMPADCDCLEDVIGEQHICASYDTPLRDNAFDLTNEEKVEIIAVHFKEIMSAMGMDLSDDSLKGTPGRVARMFVRELFSGLDPRNKPAITLFENKYRYDQLLVEKNVTFYSNCEHHFVPIIGKVHVAYISSGKVIGLSKINRIVQYYARRPQVQERLTVQIANELKDVLNTQDVAVVVDATHLCVSSRGIRDTQSSTITSSYNGRFNREETKSEFLAYVK